MSKKRNARTDSSSHARDRLLQAAAEVLQSPRIRDLAVEERKRFEAEARSWDNRVIAESLEDELKIVQDNILPALVEQSPKSIIPRGVFGTLATSWIGNFLTEYAWKGTPLRRLSQKYARALYREASCSGGTNRLVVPLVNFRAESPLRLRGKIDGKDYSLPIVRNKFPLDVSRNGLRRMPNSGHPYTGLSSRIGMPALWVLLVDVKYVRDASNYVKLGDSSATRLTDGVIRALRLFAPGDVAGPIRFSSKDSLYLGQSESMTISSDPQSFGKDYTLSQNLNRKFSSFFHRMELILTNVADIPPRIQVAIEYFESSYGRSTFSKFLDLHIALESLFNIHAEQTYRLSLQVSALLEASVVDLRRTHGFIKSCCQTRAKIAHGAKELRSPSFRKEVVEKTPTLWEIVGRAIKRHIEMYQDISSRGESYEDAITKDFESNFILGRLAQS